MTAGLGIAVGTANSDAAVTRTGDAPDGGTTSVIASRATVVHPSADGTATLGSGSAQTGRPGLTGFVDRVGDPVGILGPDGRAHPGEDLFAAAVACLADEVLEQHGTAPDERTPIVVTHPAPWNSHTVRVLESALERTGLPQALLVSEAAACLRWLESARGPQDDGVVVVYDLGAASLDVSVMRTGAEAGLLGRALRSEDVTGTQFDHLVTRHVLDDLGGKTAGFDPFDPAVVESLTALRRNCAAAKESLSTDTETVIPVALPGLETDVRLVRSELEDLVRAPLTTSLDLIREALRSAGVETGDVHHVLLAGGGGAIPLVAELVSSELGLTVVAAPNPAHTAALGAALLAADAGAQVTDHSVPAAPASAAVTRDGAYSEPVNPVFPSSLHSTRSGSNVRRRIAIIASSAAAIGVLAAGGLSIGTAANPAPAQSTPPASSAPPAENAVAGTGATPTAGGSPNGTVTVVGGTGSGTAMSPAAVTARAGAVVDPTGRAVPQSAAAPGPGTVPATAPTADDPTPGAQPTQPTYTPPPAGGGGTGPAPAAGPSPAQIGTGFGNAAEGVGKGVNSVLQGVGGVVGGVVGAVVDPVTGLLTGK